ncbi:MAG: hypothetical protein HQL30_04660, partial [Candidatus Omnitrophica bacterium]|nr:hypothetical protein [Candidatus Omnitrophota bacterium]
LSRSEFRDKLIFRRFDEIYARYRDKHPLAKPAAEPQPAPAPAYPEKLTVLIVEDDPGYRDSVRRRLGNKFSGPLVEFIYAGTMKEAVELMREREPQIAVFDMVLVGRTREEKEGNRAYEEEYFKRLNEIPVVFSVSADNGPSVTEALIAYDDCYETGLADRAKYLRKAVTRNEVEKSDFIEGAIPFIREEADKLQSEIDRAKTKIPGAGKPQSPAYPEKLIVLVVEDADEERDGVRRVLEKAFGGSKEYEFLYAGSRTEAIKSIGERKPDIVVFDIVFDKPFSDDKKEREYYKALVQVGKLYAVSKNGELVSSKYLSSAERNYNVDLSKVSLIQKTGEKGEYIEGIIPDIREKRQVMIDEYEAECDRLAHDKFRMVVFEHRGAHKRVIEVMKKKDLNIRIKHMGTNNLAFLDKYLAPREYDVDALIVHIFELGQIGAIMDIFTKVRLKNPEAYLVLEHGMSIESIREKINIFREKYGRLDCYMIPCELFPIYGEIADIALAKFGKEGVEAILPASPDAKNVIIMSENPDVILKRSIERNSAGKYNVRTVSTIYDLERALGEMSPDFVITETHAFTDKSLIGKDALAEISSRVKAAKADVKFIITSDEAFAIEEERLAGLDMAGIVGKPFHVRRVLDILNGRSERSTDTDALKQKTILYAMLRDMWHDRASKLNAILAFCECLREEDAKWQGLLDSAKRLTDGFLRVHNDIMALKSLGGMEITDLAKNLDGLALGCADILRSIEDAPDNDDIKKIARDTASQLKTLIGYVEKAPLKSPEDINKAIKDGGYGYGIVPGSPWARLLKFKWDIKLSAELDGKKVAAYADTLLKAIFLNIISNAVDHGLGRGFDMEGALIKVRSFIESGDTAVVTIEDNGKGISPEGVGVIDKKTGKQRVFDENYTTRDKTAESWHGLGLSICWDIVKMHGGEITVSPGSNGVGTLFTIKLPLAKSKTLTPFAALDREAKKEPLINKEASALAGAAQGRIPALKLKFCVPLEVLKNSPDITLALKNAGELKSRVKEGADIDFELVVTGLGEDDSDILDKLEDAGTRALLGFPVKNFTVSGIYEEEIRKFTSLADWDPLDPTLRVAAIQAFFMGTTGVNEHIIITETADSEAGADKSRRETEAGLSNDLVMTNSSVCFLVKPEEGEGVYSLSAVIRDWLESIKNGTVSTIGKALPLPVTLTPELVKAMREAWRALKSA